MLSSTVCLSFFVGPFLSYSLWLLCSSVLFCFLLPEKDVCFVVAPLRAPEEALLLRTLSLRAIKLRWLYGLFWSFLCDGLSYVYTNVDFLISHVTRCVLRSTLIKWFMYPVLVLTCHFSAEDYCSILIFTWHFTDNWWRRYFFFPSYCTQPRLTFGSLPDSDSSLILDFSICSPLDLLQHLPQASPPPHPHPHPHPTHSLTLLIPFWSSPSSSPPPPPPP